MGLKTRINIAKWIGEVLKVDTTPTFLTRLSSTLEIRKNENNHLLELHLPVIKARNLLHQRNDNDNTALISRIVDAKYDNPIVKSVAIQNDSRVPKIIFALQNDTFVKEIVDDVKNVRKDLQLLREKVEKILVEFSSPNIAKPFHVGHLRSTIIGNFIANLHEYLGNDVVRMNYLGDWGTQYGLLKYGVQMLDIKDEELRKNPILNLYKAYVAANQAASSNPKIAEEARRIFASLESNVECNDRQTWQQYRNYTVDELKVIYNRLGVKFNIYEWESQYGQKHISDVVSLLEEKGLLLDEKDGRKIVEVGDRRVPVIKSNGTTLYLARDIAAILERFQKHQFDRAIYVVDNAQTDHFNALFNVVSRVEPKLKNRTVHIKFGRIKGMSTRQGTVVFLKDVLDEACEKTKQKQIESPTTKVPIGNMENNTADILGVTAVLVNDLKQKRQKDYEYDWDKVLQVHGDTGVKLQYTHCRLCSLLDSTGILPAENVEPKLLQEPEALSLIADIGRFPEVIHRSEDRLEACDLVNYLFVLSNNASRALKRLNIKHEESKVLQQQRMLLFTSAKRILFDGMRILGLQPLEKM